MILVQMILVNMYSKQRSLDSLHCIKGFVRGVLIKWSKFGVEITG